MVICRWLWAGAYIESAKANDLEPFAYLGHIAKLLPYADTVDKLEQLLPWACEGIGSACKKRVIIMDKASTRV